MSHFYGILTNYINNQRTLRGHKTNGIDATVKSWNSQGCIYLSADKDTEKDIYSITIKGNNIKQVFLNGKVVKIG